MKLVLTPQLLRFLTRNGYNYCLSRIVSDETDRYQGLMTLVPLRRRPSMRVINKGYDALFAIDGEPARLADEPGDILVMIQMDTPVILRYLKTLLQTSKKNAKCLNVY